MRLLQIEWLSASKEEAESVVEKLLVQKLIACANISTVESRYIWQGRLERCSEVKVVMKTLEKHFETISQEIQRLGSYEVPCILGTYVDRAHIEYFDWVKKTVSCLL